MPSIDKHGNWCPGPCLTTATWCCHKNFSQWEWSFHWKLRCHWLEFLQQRQIAVIRQGPDGCKMIPKSVTYPFENIIFYEQFIPCKNISCHTNFNLAYPYVLSHITHILGIKVLHPKPILLEWANILFVEITGIVWYCAKNLGTFSVQIFPPGWWK